MSRQPFRRINFRTDEGSSLPLFIFGTAFLVCLALVALASGQLLKQQRRINGAADTVALDLVARGLANGSTSDPSALSNAATQDLADLYPNSSATAVAVESREPGVEQVRVCAPAHTLLNQLGAQMVCATSRAGLG